MVHVHDKESLLQELQQTEKALKASEQLRMRALANKSAYENQLKENEEELKALGTTAEKAEEEIARIDQQIAEKLKQINEMIPYDLLNKYNLLK